MKKQILATAALLALTAQAQVSGPNRPGPGTSPGTFQQPSAATTTPDTSGTIAAPVPDITAPVPDITTPVPQTRIGTPDATARGTEPFRSDVINRNGSVNDSRDWERSLGAPGQNQNGSGRMTPPPDITPTPRPLDDKSTFNRSSIPGASTTPRVGSDLNTSGINTPPRMNEQPLDRALSAKIRAQLSQTPPAGKTPAVRVSPETVRDLRITSQNGRIVLEGNVASQQEKDVIEVRAKEVQGVAAIDNRLKVRNQSQGAPASTQTGQSEQTPRSGQTPRNSSDLNDDHSELTPDR
jgi:hypothetical protein